MIFIDDRENPDRVKILKRMGLTYQIRRLTDSDADMCNKMGRAEIKELKDWVQATLSNKRYWKQLYNHIITDRRPYLLVVCGNVAEAKKALKKYRPFTRAQVIEAMAEAYVRGAGIDIVFFEEEKDAVYFAYKFLKYCEEDKWGLPKIPRLTLYQRKKLGRPNPEELKVMRIFNVNKSVAQNLIKKFTSLKGICLADKRKLETVDGVGPTIARRIAGVK